MVSFTEILTNICFHKSHIAMISHIFPLSCTLFINAFSLKFCLKKLLKKEYTVISLGVYSWKSSAPASQTVSMFVWPFWKLFAVEDVIQPRGTKRSLWPWWPNPQGRGAAANQALSARTWAQAPCEVQLAQNHISNCNNQFASKSRAKMCMYKLIVNSF